jgi:tetratricopeptide (TPR) repeat protein
MFWRRNKPVYAPKARVSRGQPLSLWERHFERGLEAFEKKQYDDALADLDEAIVHNARIGELYATRGLILLEMGKTDEAQDDLDYALKVDARQWLVHYALGLSAYRKKEFDEAIKHLSNAQRFAPMRAEILYTRALANYEQGNLKRAEMDIDSAIQVMDTKDKRQKDAKAFLKQVQADLKSQKS